MICTCISFPQHCCCSDARIQDVGGVEQSVIIARVAEMLVGYEQLKIQTQAGVKYKNIGNKNKLPF